MPNSDTPTSSVCQHFLQNMYTRIGIMIHRTNWFLNKNENVLKCDTMIMTTPWPNKKHTVPLYLFWKWGCFANRGFSGLGTTYRCAQSVQCPSDVVKSLPKKRSHHCCVQHDGGWDPQWLFGKESFTINTMKIALIANTAWLIISWFCWKGTACVCTGGSVVKILGYWSLLGLWARLSTLSASGVPYHGLPCTS